ncbi:RnfABCDGE type electron transport complex subunit G [Pseudomonas xantholysinigenes]|uniref:Ion-translocating oxidoreductase complex subunit G n=1 Tax=Pseudomonas xantholysinigenes TaxID=2745490 RepID=A0A9E6PYQ5_9PSED|nr:RnfABCDGE type electron transport complex subunit G [Pseudomonas xantholysinigenes]QXI39584.1 RnfABCDGE type electron transport complex subunit G [Pseudomonas xantholysinigenes]
MSTRWRNHLLLLLVTTLAVLATLAWQRWTAAPIAEARQQWQERQWLAVLPPGSYDNRPLAAALSLEHPTLAHSRLLAGYRASLAGNPVAILLHSRCQGYGGPIDLAIAIDRQGRLIGVQVLAQQESPGLGDQLVNPAVHWLEQFIGQTRTQDWALKRDHGAFDQLAGATVTSRAVIDALQDALRYFDEHRPALLGEVAP